MTEEKKKEGLERFLTAQDGKRGKSVLRTSYLKRKTD